MHSGRIIEIKCRCGYLLFRYYKAGKGRLIKCIISKLTEDFVGLQNAKTFSRPKCPHCGKEIGIVKMIQGEPALKLNQGTIESIRL